MLNKIIRNSYVVLIIKKMNWLVKEINKKKY